MVHVKDLPYDKSKIEVKTDLEEILVKVEPPQKEEVVAPPAEVPAEGEAPAAEGEVPAAEEGQPAEAEAKPKE
jgi:hypothetical protein